METCEHNYIILQEKKKRNQPTLYLKQCIKCNNIIISNKLIEKQTIKYHNT